MEVAGYSSLALDNFGFQHPAAFYGQTGAAAVGAGLIYTNVRFPLFDLEHRAFDTAEGAAYVLTHECDVDPANERHFNDHVVVCPLIRLEDFVAEYEAKPGEERLKAFLVNAAKNEVVRVFYLPPGPPLSVLSYGALLYLNQLCSTHVSVFQPAYALCALSSQGLERLDWKLQNLLFRPKVDPLPRLR